MHNLFSVSLHAKRLSDDINRPFRKFQKSPFFDDELDSNLETFSGKEFIFDLLEEDWKERPTAEEALEELALWESKVQRRMAGGILSPKKSKIIDSRYSSTKYKKQE